MSLDDALALAALIDAARDDFVAGGEAALEDFHLAARAVLAGNPDGTEARRLLALPAGALLAALAGVWRERVNRLLRQAHGRLNLPPPTPVTADEARAFMQPAVTGLLSAGLLTARTASPLGQAGRAWDRQYETGGAFTALRGAMRGATAGTLTTLAVASVVDTTRERGGDWVLGAYNPLDERTAPLDRELVLNRGRAITTARGRVVRSIPGQVGKYTPANAWVPGPPRYGGDTHDGCRCVLIPERLPV